MYVEPFAERNDVDEQDPFTDADEAASTSWATPCISNRLHMRTDWDPLEVRADPTLKKRESPVCAYIVKEGLLVCVCRAFGIYVCVCI